MCLRLQLSHPWVSELWCIRSQRDIDVSANFYTNYYSLLPIRIILSVFYCNYYTLIGFYNTPLAHCVNLVKGFVCSLYTVLNSRQ